MKEKAKQEKRVLLGEGEDGDEDEGDGPSPGWRMFFSLLLLSVSPPYALLFFFVMGSLLCFLSSVVSPAFYFFLLYFCPQSSVFIGDTPGLLSAHGLSLDKHDWKGCLGVSLGLGYLSLFLIFSVAVIFMKIGFETPCFGWIGTPTVLPLLDCWWWFPSRCWHVMAAKDTKID
jgi:hypothetical protein